MAIWPPSPLRLPTASHHNTPHNAPHALQNGSPQPISIQGRQKSIRKRSQGRLRSVSDDEGPSVAVIDEARPTKRLDDAGTKHEYIEMLATGSLTPTQLEQNVALASQAEKIDSITTREFLRTYHPVLSRVGLVGMFTFRNDDPVWYVFDPMVATSRTIGGRPLHLMPKPITPIHCYHISTDPLDQLIDPKRNLGDELLRKLRAIFPKTRAAVVYSSGFIGLSMDRDALIEAVETDIYWPATVGGLKVGMEVATVVWSSKIATTPDANPFTTVQAALGLRLRFHNGEEVLTGATHAFVTGNKGPNLQNPYSSKNMFKMLGISLANLKPVQALARTPAVAWCLNHLYDINPLGKKVYLGKSVKFLGTVTKTFDSPSSGIPYPAGYNHALSFITNDNGLPEMVAPPKMPILERRFADPESVLDGSPVFTMIHQLIQGHKFRAMPGTVLGMEVREEVVDGIRYDWGLVDAHKVTRSLLWRTILKDDTGYSVEGASGCVLASGNPTDLTAKAICFQNFEVPFPIPMHALAVEPASMADCRGVCRYKAGFFLPEEVMIAEIVIDRTKAESWNGRHNAVGLQPGRERQVNSNLV
ncbi:hypothetical protein BJ508DRAFT_320166 [Ascobolus immersus RN42]|uniref:Uncharacterized protein n=1 Tax=Ascobolus immersus RN42 TaxID=1160509 RepID=A0A3N4ITK6_ASCIM|nr:hypothetical protein BJ508DRAFT_320166 [Ascobolus immersus RN42]